MRRCGKKKLSFVFIFCSQAFVEERFMRSKRTCFFLFQNCNCNNCNAKMSLGNCYIVIL